MKVCKRKSPDHEFTEWRLLGKERNQFTYDWKKKGEQRPFPVRIQPSNQGIHRAEPLPGLD